MASHLATTESLLKAVRVLTAMVSSNDSIDATTQSLMIPTEEVAEGGGGDEEQYDTEYISRILFNYFAPILIFGGIAGNVLSFIVLQGKFFRKSPSSFILSALSITDTCVLLTGLLRNWIRALTNEAVDVRNLTNAGCKFHFVLTYMLPQLSAWTLMLMTFERLMSVTFPMRAREICSKRKMMGAWFIIAIFLFIFNSPPFRTMELAEQTYMIDDTVYVVQFCYYPAEYEYFMVFVWPWIDFCLVVFIPFLFIAISNGIIIFNVVSAMRMRKTQMQSQAQGDNASVQSLTRMLVAVSIVFLLTTTPSGIFFAGFDAWPKSTSSDVYRVYVGYGVTTILLYANNSLNFLLYFVTGSRFRRALLATLCCREEEKSTSKTSKTMSTVVSTAMTTTKDGEKEGEKDVSGNGVDNSHI